MKIVLVMLDEDERVKGRGFVKRVKGCDVDVKYPEHESASWQKLRDNATRRGPGNGSCDTE